MEDSSRTRSKYMAKTIPLPSIVAAMFRNTRMKLRVPNPIRHLSPRIIPAGPALTNLETPNATVTTDVEKVVMKRGSIRQMLMETGALQLS